MIDSGVDFHVRRWRSPAVLLGALLLLVNAGIALSLWSRLQSLEEQKQALYQVEALVSSPAKHVQMAPSTLTPDALASLGFRWDSLFNALNGARRPGISLETITPDAVSGELALQGTATDFSALKAYLVALSETGFRDPVLQSESIVDASGQLRFAIRVRWAG